MGKDTKDTFNQESEGFVTSTGKIKSAYQLTGRALDRALRKKKVQPKYANAPKIYEFRK